jgi:isocitrate dehydrogenase (NAD+)
MLEHLGELDAAKRVDRAVKEILREGKFVTPDLNKSSKCGTKEFADEIVKRLR